MCWGGGTRCILSVSGIRAQPLPPHVRVSWFQDDAAHHLCLCVFGVCSPEFIDQLWRVLLSLGCAPVFDRLVIPPILITLRNLVFDTYLQEGACRGGACTWCLQLESGGGGGGEASLFVGLLKECQGSWGAVEVSILPIWSTRKQLQPPLISIPQ